MNKKETIHVLHDGDWMIEHQGQKYGNYPSKEEAAATARSWAENAAKQGYSVQVVVHDQKGPAFTLLNLDPPVGASSSGRAVA
jgi:hypothetical protein